MVRPDIGGYFDIKRLKVGTESTIYLARTRIRELPGQVVIKYVSRYDIRQRNKRRKELKKVRLSGKKCINHLRNENVILSQFPEGYEQHGIVHMHRYKEEGLMKHLKFFGCLPYRAYMVMEYIKGTTLNQHRMDSLREKIRWYIGSAKVLEYINRFGFVHHDVKPENIMITPGGNVKLIDFGLTCKIGMRFSAVRGTFRYMAAEQWGKGVIDQQTDVCSLGLTMYEIIVNPRVVENDLSYEWVDVYRKRDLPSMRKEDKSIPAKLDDLVLASISKRKKDRPKNMDEVIDRLEEISF